MNAVIDDGIVEGQVLLRNDLESSLGTHASHDGGHAGNTGSRTSTSRFRLRMASTRKKLTVLDTRLS